MAGMAESDFWDNEVWCVLNRIDAWGEDKKHTEKSELQRLSILGAWVLAPHTGKGKKVKPETLIPDVWADAVKEKHKPLTKEERKKIFAKHDKIIRKLKAQQ